MLGLALPFALVFIDRYVFHGSPFPRDSESAYYYSGMREWFVITVGTSGFFFIAYKITESTLENTLSVVAGIAAVLIASFPTGRTTAEKHAGYPKTPLQKLLGEGNVADVHLYASMVFVLALAGISVLFGLGERNRTLRLFHFGCAGVILLAFVWSLATYSSGPRWSILAGEVAVSLAFGASWFVKGAQFRYLLGRVA